MFRVFPEALDPCFAFCALSRSSPCNAYQHCGGSLHGHVFRCHVVSVVWSFNDGCRWLWSVVMMLVQWWWVGIVDGGGGGGG